MRRRELMALLGLSSVSSISWSQNKVPIADAHNHIGLLRRNTDSVPKLAALMRESGVNLLSWTVCQTHHFLGLVLLA
jgi:hypothetical protein